MLRILPHIQYILRHIQYNIVFLVIGFLPFSARTQDSLITKQMSIFASKIDSLSGKIDSLSKKDQEQPIGILRLNPRLVDHFYRIGRQFMKMTNPLLIDSIAMNMKDGYILDIHIFSGNKRFTNLSAPINLQARRLENEVDHLVNPVDKNESIIFQQTVIPDSLTSYFAEDGFYKLTRTYNKLILYRKIGLNTVIDLRLYTDALGLFGKNANGIIQTDAHIKQILNNRNNRNHGFFWLHYLKVNFNASKFTNANSYVDSAHFSRTSLIQKSNISGDITLNAFSQWLGVKSVSDWYGDVGLGFNEVNLVRGADTSSVVTSNYFVELGINLKNSDNVGFSSYVRVLDQFSPQTDWGNNSAGHLFCRIGAEVYYNPWDNPASRIFARLNYTFATSKDDNKNNFFQLQFGYSVLLSSLFKK